MNFSKLTLTTTALISAVALGGAAAAQTPMTKADGEWVLVTGDIAQISPQGFHIATGNGVLPVEMDGYLSTSTQGLRAGDWVTVSGRIDDGMWERRSIEAASVYSSRLRERFRANPTDEEGDYMGFALIDVPDQGDWVGVTGRVVSIAPAQNEMIVDVGTYNIQVDTTPTGRAVMATPGDRVSVYGRLDDADLWDAREIDAISVVILSQG